MFTIEQAEDTLVNKKPKQAAVKKTAVKPAIKCAAAKKAAAAKSPTKSQSESASSDSGTCSNSESGAESDSVLSKPKKPSRMPKITLMERICVMDWCAKERKDKKMTNARWIRHGGAKGQGMTATSGEVRTCGAHEALAT